MSIWDYIHNWTSLNTRRGYIRRDEYEIGFSGLIVSHNSFTGRVKFEDRTRTDKARGHISERSLARPEHYQADINRSSQVWCIFKINRLERSPLAIEFQTKFPLHYPLRDKAGVFYRVRIRAVGRSAARFGVDSNHDVDICPVTEGRLIRVWLA